MLVAPRSWFVCAGAAGALVCSTAWAGPIEDLQPGHWFEVQGSHLRNVVPSPAPPGNPIQIMFAWSGGAYDTKRDRLIVWGGGHGDYGGNEIYAFDIATLKWSRIWGPSPNIPATGGPCMHAYSDGNPVARHTYDGLAYLPALDQLLIYGGSQFCGSGGAGEDAWVFDFCCDKWTQKASAPTTAELFMALTYDPTSGHAFMVNEATPLMEYDPAKDAWTKRSEDSVDYRTVVVAAIDPGRRKWVGLSEDLGPTGKILTSTLTASGNIPLVETPTNGANQFLGKRVGLEYDPVSDRMVAWGGEGDIHSLDVDTMTWELHSAANEPVPTLPPQSGGVYGRWRYIPSKNAFIAVNSIDDDVWFYKFAPGSGTTDGGGGKCGTCPNPDGGADASSGTGGSATGTGGSTGTTGGASNMTPSSGGKSAAGGGGSNGSGGKPAGAPDAGTKAGASSATDAGTAKATEDSGCGCRVGNGGAHSHAPWALTLGVGLLSLRRRRHRLAPL